MKKIIFVFIFIFSLLAFLEISCVRGNKLPNGILSQPKMQAVLWDIIRTDEFVTRYALPKDTSGKRFEKSIELYDQVFRMHHVTREEFQKSFSFYQLHPALLKQVLDSIYTKQSTAPPKFYKPWIKKIDSLE